MEGNPSDYTQRLQAITYIIETMETLSLDEIRVVLELIERLKSDGAERQEPPAREP